MTNTINIPADINAAHDLAVNGERHPEVRYCRMGQDYDCNCYYCNPARHSAACAEVDARNVATAEHRAHVAAIAGSIKILAQIGRVFATAFRAYAALGTLAAWAADAWTRTDGNVKGFYFRVDGKRGNAKAHHGKVGVCVWAGVSSFATAGRVSETQKLGLKFPGEDKPVYLPASCATRLPIPVEVQAERAEREVVKSAIAPHRPRWTGTVPAKSRRVNVAKWIASCPAAYVVQGRHAGAQGRVFWIGADKQTGEAGARLGLETASGETLWLSAYDCRNEAPTARVTGDERTLVERIAADAALEGRAEEARALLAQIG